MSGPDDGPVRPLPQSTCAVQLGAGLRASRPAHQFGAAVCAKCVQSDFQVLPGGGNQGAWPLDAQFDMPPVSRMIDAGQTEYPHRRVNFLAAFHQWPQRSFDRSEDAPRLLGMRAAVETR